MYSYTTSSHNIIIIWLYYQKAQRGDSMQEAEKAYITCIIDGEGSIMLIKFHNNLFPSPCISIASTTIELLEWVKFEK